MVLAKIAEIDLTDYIIAGTYKTNSAPIFKEWQDEAGGYHRNLTRTRVTASFNLDFSGGGSIDYPAFITLLQQALVGMKLTMNLYITNENVRRDVTGYYSMAPAVKTAADEGVVYDTFTFLLEEC